MDMLKQKTFWAGLVLVITGIGEFIVGDGAAQAVSHIASGLGLIFLRQAVAKVEGE